MTKGPVRDDSDTQYRIVGGAGDASKPTLNAAKARLESGSSFIEILHSGNIKISCPKLEIDAEVVDLSASDKFDVYAADTYFHGTKVDFKKAKLDGSKQGTLFA